MPPRRSTRRGRIRGCGTGRAVDEGSSVTDRGGTSEPRGGVTIAVETGVATGQGVEEDVPPPEFVRLVYTTWRYIRAQERVQAEPAPPQSAPAQPAPPQLAPPQPAPAQPAPPQLAPTQTAPLQLVIGRDMPRMLKSMRQMGCTEFTGRQMDSTDVRQWLDRVVRVARDLALSEEDRLRVAVRLLEGDAASWWEIVIARYIEAPSWEIFERELMARYYTREHRKRREFYSLTQGTRTVAEYETEYRELAKYVPKLTVTDKEYLQKFEEGLSTTIRERITVTPDMDFATILFVAQQAEDVLLTKSTEDRAATRAGPSSSRKRPVFSSFSFVQSRPYFQRSRAQGLGGTSFTSSYRPPQSRFTAKDTRVCYICNMPGHIARNCRAEGTSGSHASVRGLQMTGIERYTGDPGIGPSGTLWDRGRDPQPSSSSSQGSTTADH